MIELYGIRTCDSCRKARRWLEDQEIEFRFIDIRDEALTESRLKRWQKELGWEPLLNKKSITWRKIPPFDRAVLNGRNARALILNHPTVMKRPILDLGPRIVVGFDAENYAALQLQRLS